MTKRKPIDSDRIVGGEAFRAINLMIDQKAQELADNMEGFKTQFEHVYERAGSVSIRVSYEPGGRADMPLPAQPYAFAKILPPYLADIERLEREINDLQRFKLRLLNDYDFTHGDDEQQRAVFG